MRVSFLLCHEREREEEEEEEEEEETGSFWSIRRKIGACFPFVFFVPFRHLLFFLPPFLLLFPAWADG
ncbi:hypothetical protein LY76DRAFT_598194 [Colletotrichum caudatum]|nr:hypothetical protein LY76DRAFT_598194 [Colletotrichum caudatum]